MGEVQQSVAIDMGVRYAVTAAVVEMQAPRVIPNHEGLLRMPLALNPRIAPVGQVADLLANLKSAAEVYLGHPVSGVLLTAPGGARPDLKARLRQAGQRAGLTVLAVLDEPTAICMAYRPEAGGSLGHLAAQQPRLALIGHLRAGTWTVSVVLMTGEQGYNLLISETTPGFEQDENLDFAARILDQVAQALNRVDLAPDYVDDVLLAGEIGANSLIRSYFEARFGPQRVASGPDPAHAVAIGAAFAGALLGEQLVCHECEHVNPLHAQQCGNCGVPLRLAGRLICANCGFPNTPNRRTCERCGQAMESEPSAEPEGGLEGQVNTAAVWSASKAQPAPDSGNMNRLARTSLYDQRLVALDRHTTKSGAQHYPIPVIFAAVLPPGLPEGTEVRGICQAPISGETGSEASLQDGRSLPCVRLMGETGLGILERVRLAERLRVRLGDAITDAMGAVLDAQWQRVFRGLQRGAQDVALQHARALYQMLLPLPAASYAPFPEAGEQPAPDGETFVEAVATPAPVPEAAVSPESGGAEAALAGTREASAEALLEDVPPAAFPHEPPDPEGVVGLPIPAGAEPPAPVTEIAPDFVLDEYTRLVIAATANARHTVRAALEVSERMIVGVQALSADRAVSFRQTLQEAQASLEHGHDLLAALIAQTTEVIARHLAAGSAGRPCPNCGAPATGEAPVCPICGADLTPGGQSLREGR
ncbi:MAG: Hsp70 family protein [Anaerolineae bacterium]|nr:Hsp70 family protein [Anaerolineae bacterium]